MTEILKRRKIFKCKICAGDKLAEHFANDLNKISIRGLRLVCCRCAPSFNQLSLNSRREFLKQKIGDYYGEKQYIYALCEPETKVVRYVGRTDNPQRRFNAHIQSPRAFAKEICFYSGVLKCECNCDQHKLWKNKIDSKSWIAKLMAKELKPVMKILEEVEPGWLVAEREIRHICQLIKENNEILNSENQSEKSRVLIKKQIFSFLDIDIEELEISGFLRKFEFSLHLHESGWRRALQLHQVFSTDIDLRFDESNHWDK